MELLVAVAISLIGIVIMFQMWQVSDQQKGTTSSGTDAQINGAISLFDLERDIKQGGFGFGTSSTIGCTVSAYDSARSGNFNFTLAPVVITDGAAGAPDTIDVLYGSSDTYSSTQIYSASSASLKVTNTRIGIRNGDLLIVADSDTSVGCGLVEITDTSNADNRTINHNSGSYTNANGQTVTARYNVGGGLNIAFTTGELHNFGQNPVLHRYSIRNNKFLSVSNELRFSDTSPADGTNDWAELSEGIIDLQAEYGLDTNNDTIVDTWQSAVPTQWQQVRAIRVALLSRSQQFEKTAITSTAPTWTSATGARSFVMRNVDGTADSNLGDATDWRHYRYRVFETVIPLRNMLWGTAP